ncbi:hypothetical protein C8R48DRAFT_728541 [Suillus tomentosus]|nr:hypothetical protein C8R48DRAFT_728541 [Suillus tomentosus]
MSAALRTTFLLTSADIELHELQKTLDAQGIEIVDNQRESVLLYWVASSLLTAQKVLELVQRPAQRSAYPLVSDLLSIANSGVAYQTEIDNLTKRLKVSENAFLNDQTVKATEAHALEAEVARLHTENAELRQSSSAFDGSKRRVEQLETRMDELVTQKEFEINAAYDERMHNYEEREHDLHRQVALYRDQVRDLRLSNESNQAKLFDHSQCQGKTDMITINLERAKSRVVTVEQRNHSVERWRHCAHKTCADYDEVKRELDILKVSTRMMIGQVLTKTRMECICQTQMRTKRMHSTARVLKRPLGQKRRVGRVRRTGRVEFRG